MGLHRKNLFINTSYSMSPQKREDICTLRWSVERCLGDELFLNYWLRLSVFTLALLSFNFSFILFILCNFLMTNCHEIYYTFFYVFTLLRCLIMQKDEALTICWFPINTSEITIREIGIYLIGFIFRYQQYKVSRCTLCYSVTNGIF